MNFTFKKLEVSELTKESAFKAAQETDNFKLNLACQVIIFGNVEPLNNVGIEGLRAINFMEMRSLVPAKYKAADDKWELDKTEVEEVRKDFMIERDDATAFDELAGNLYRFLQSARQDKENKIKAETIRQNKEKKDKKAEKAAKDGLAESKKQAVGKAIKKEVERKGEELSAGAVIAAMMEQFGTEATEQAMIELLEAKGFQVVAAAQQAA